MTFSQVAASKEILNALDLSERNKDGSPISYDIFMRHNGKDFYYRCYQYDDREYYYSHSTLFIGTTSYSVQEKTKYTAKHGISYFKLLGLTIESDFPVTRSLRVKLLKILSELAPAISDFRSKTIKYLIIDKTKDRKPRSISKLIVFLNKFSRKLNKTQYIHLQNGFLSFLYDDEIVLLHNHIRKTDGKGFTPLALLFFELGYEKRKDRLEASSSPIVDEKR